MPLVVEEKPEEKPEERIEERIQEDVEKLGEGNVKDWIRKEFKSNFWLIIINNGIYRTNSRMGV